MDVRQLSVTEMHTAHVGPGRMVVSKYDRWNAWLVTAILLSSFLTGVFALAVWQGRPTVKYFLSPLVIENPEVDARQTGVIDPLSDCIEPEVPFTDINRISEYLQSVVEAADREASQGDQEPGGFGLIGIQPGPAEREDPETRGRPRRWNIQYQVPDRQAYGELLSHFGLEIGVVHTKNNTIWRVADPGNQAAVTISSRQQENEPRSFYFAHTDKKTHRWDEQMVHRAGVSVEDCLLVQFISREFEEQLAQLEAEFTQAQGRSIDQVRMTVFGLSASHEGFSLTIVEQRYHAATAGH
ncbi:MAG TPA: hypothetical protein PKD54_11830 [Pirellulaceae bacterium]|nr:hypothetical protein [Pirellulaceae bacterium]